MKRLLITAGVLATLALAGTAWGSSQAFDGDTYDDPDDPSGNGGHVYYSLVFKHGKPRKVKNFTWASVPGECDQGPAFAPEPGEPLDPIKVKDNGKFSASPRIGGTQGHPIDAFVHGKIPAGGAIANLKGTLKVTGDYDPGSADLCSTGTDTWYAYPQHP